MGKEGRHETARTLLAMLLTENNDLAVNVTGIAHDSRFVKPGDLLLFEGLRVMAPCHAVVRGGRRPNRR